MLHLGLARGAARVARAGRDRASTRWRRSSTALGDRLGPNAEPLRQAVAAAPARLRRGGRRDRRGRRRRRRRALTRMGQRIEDYALIGDTQTAALVGQATARSTGCACPASTPARSSRRCSATATTDGGRSRPAGGLQRVERALPRRHARARDDVPHRRRRRAPHRLHADPRPDRRHRARRRRRLGPGPDAHGPRRSGSTTGRSCRGSAAPTTGSSARSPAPTRSCLRTPVHTHGAGKATVADFVVEAGETVPFVLAYHASHEPRPAPLDADARGQGDRALVAAAGRRSARTRASGATR